VEYKDYYKILGVERDAGADDIKRAYRKLARKYHPDVSSEADAQNKFQELQEAYEVLKDPEKRQAYDELGQNWQQGQDFRPPPDWEQHFDFGGGGFTGGDAASFSDFFESLFGGAAGGHAQGFRGGGFAGRGFGGAGGFHGRGQDHTARVEIPLETAYRGGQQTITMKRPEADAGGNVQARERSLNVRIPAGVTDGQQIRLSGQGGAGMGQGGSGDLYLEIRLKPHQHFRPEGRDIHLNLPIAPWEAALGATVTVPTLGGHVDTRIPEGARSGQRMRLKGRGLPGSPPGDQYLHLRIVAPRPRNYDERELYEKMRETMNLDPRADLKKGSGA